MANLGATIFEHLLRQEALKQQKFEQEKALDREKQLVDSDRLLRAVEQKRAQDESEFERQYKVADLWGKYGAQSGESSAKKMSNPALQEMADVSFGLEKQRIPTGAKEYEATRLPFELARQRNRLELETAKTGRANMLEEGRMIRASEANSLRGKIEQRKAMLTKAKLDYEEARNTKMDPIKIRLMESQIGQMEADQAKDTSDWFENVYDNLTRLAQEQRGVAGRPDVRLEQAMNYAGQLGVQVRYGLVKADQAAGDLNKILTKLGLSQALSGTGSGKPGFGIDPQE